MNLPDTLLQADLGIEGIDTLRPVRFSGSAHKQMFCDAHHSVTCVDGSEGPLCGHLFRGWQIDQPGGPSFGVLAWYHDRGVWSFSIGFVGDSDEGHDIGSIPSQVTRSGVCGYSTVLQVWVADGSSVRPIRWNEQ